MKLRGCSKNLNYHKLIVLTSLIKLLFDRTEIPFCCGDEALRRLFDLFRIFVETAIEMMRSLTYADEEGQRLLKNLVLDIVDSLPKVSAKSKLLVALHSTL